MVVLEVDDFLKGAGIEEIKTIDTDILIRIRNKGRITVEIKDDEERTGIELEKKCRAHIDFLVIQKICSLIHEYWKQIQNEINPESEELDQDSEDDPERYKPKHHFDTFEKWQKSVEESYHNLHRVVDETMKVLPVNFATEHKQMLAHLHMLINKEYLAIPKEYDKLIISLRTAYANEYSLDKEQTSYSDSLDALRLSCKMYPIKDEI